MVITIHTIGLKKFLKFKPQNTNFYELSSFLKVSLTKLCKL